MPRMSKKRKQEWALFLNDRNRITYNELCRKCSSEYGERGAAAAGAVLKPSGGNCAVLPKETFNMFPEKATIIKQRLF